MSGKLWFAGASKRKYLDGVAVWRDAEKITPEATDKENNTYLGQKGFYLFDTHH